MNRKKTKPARIPHLILLFLFLQGGLYSQDAGGDYLKLFNEKNFTRSAEVVEKRLREFYAKRVEYRVVSLDFITMKKPESEIDLKKFFKNRKNSNMFIEENREVFNLHIHAGRCYNELKKYDSSLNHYMQSLRFKNLELHKDDAVFYEIAQVYRKKNRTLAYLNMLELAYTLNPEKYSYSHELGMQLARTGERKKGIYHLERYVKHTEENLDPHIFLTIGNLYEDLGKYLETEKYYQKYLEQKPGDPHIIFALANLSFQRTGNHAGAFQLFRKAIELLPETEIYRKSKSYEYMADISWKELDYRGAIESYRQVIRYQESVRKQVSDAERKIGEIDAKILALKASIMTKKDFDDFSAYEMMQEDRGKAEQELSRVMREYNKLNPGKVRWFMADSFEKSGDYQEAMGYYRESIAFNYNSNEAREKITKLQLKIKRGY